MRILGNTVQLGVFLLVLGPSTRDGVWSAHLGDDVASSTRPPGDQRTLPARSLVGTVSDCRGDLSFPEGRGDSCALQHDPRGPIVERASCYQLLNLRLGKKLS